MITKNITITATKNWQSEPTKPGIYLLRNSNIKEELVFVYKSVFKLSIMHADNSLTELENPKYENCKWFGPIKL